MEDMVVEMEYVTIDGTRSLVMNNAEQYAPGRLRLHGDGELGI
jgi:hypothetical protein